jgi:hypothetical protein
MTFGPSPNISAPYLASRGGLRPAYCITTVSDAGAPVCKDHLTNPSRAGFVNTEGIEIGLERMERRLTENGVQPLKDIANKIMTELAAFGIRRDDQSLLLIRLTR